MVYTHFGNDLNLDHRICFDCASVAIRPYRKTYIKKIMTFEVPSSSGFIHQTLLILITMLEYQKIVLKKK